MKSSQIVTSVLALTLVAASGCASAPKPLEGSAVSQTGPTVVDARPNPTVFELNKDLVPKKSAEVIADVKDYEGNINDVRLRFTHVPIEIPMTNVKGSTWHAELSPDQLRQLAVNGQTMKYDATVIATNDKGVTAQSSQPVQVTIVAPAG